MDDCVKNLGGNKRLFILEVAFKAAAAASQLNYGETSPTPRSLEEVHRKRSNGEHKGLKVDNPIALIYL